MGISRKEKKLKKKQGTQKMIQRRKDTDVERVTEKKEKMVKEQERKTEGES